MNKLPIVAIVGRPNVGKSTLFNRLYGRKVAITAREAGTTRDSVTGEISWDGKNFILIDTAGLLFDFYGFKETEIEQKAQEKLSQVISACDVILFVFDGKAGLTNEDKRVANLIRKSAKRVIMVMNKADNDHLEGNLNFAEELGFNERIAVSSITGRRSGQLLDLVTKKFQKNQAKEKSDVKRISIVGRPNVGKSSLFNLLTGEEYAIVSSIAGTTRDSIKMKMKLSGKEVEIVDTAGFRKRGKIQVGIEKFSILRAVESIFQSDIVLLVIDAKEGFTRTDAHLVALAQKNSKQVIVVVNKIDLLAKKLTSEIKDFDRYGFIRKNPLVALSTKTKENVDKFILELSKYI